MWIFECENGEDDVKNGGIFGRIDDFGESLEGDKLHGLIGCEMSGCLYERLEEEIDELCDGGVISDINIF